MTLATEDTIVAAASPPGRGAVSLIRISGKKTLSIVSTLLLKKESTLLPRRVCLSSAYTQRGETIDQVLSTYFPAPASYTGEDVAEISCHGSPVIVSRIVEEVVEMGARLARPGEFTMRAFLNGKLDLSQAEAVRDLVESQTEFQAQLARRQLAGELSAKLRPIREALVEIVSQFESTLEFVEDAIAPASREELMLQMEVVAEATSRLTSGFAVARIIQEGLRIVLLGKPNSGKSSIFNKLVSEERALVTEVPGTTRDSLRERIDISGVPVTLIDTAGIREGSGLVERLGVERSFQETADADGILFVVDLSRVWEAEDERIWEKIRGHRYLLIRNKRDLKERLLLPERVQRECGEALTISAKEDEKLDPVATGIMNLMFAQGGIEREQTLVTSARQQECLKQAEFWLERARDAAASGSSEEYVVYDLKKALEALGEVTGEANVEEILEKIFSTFCIGK